CEADMQTPLECYESELRKLPADVVCADPWFTEQLMRYRSGDEDARRAICASCLVLVLDIAKRTWRPGNPLDILDWIQEGNAALMKFIRLFTGTGAREFLQQLPPYVQWRLALLEQHPG